MTSPTEKMDSGSNNRLDDLKKFQHEEVLNVDQSSRRIVLKGTIDAEPALVLVERAAFSEESDVYLRNLPKLLTQVQQLNCNDIYSWFLASTKVGSDAVAAVGGTAEEADVSPPELKVNLIWPCTDKTVRKYRRQQVRTVTETPDIYERYVKRYIIEKRGQGSVRWVYNILDGITEQDDILLRGDGFLMLPDLNWDRSTLSSLHLLAIATRRDIWSLRDLCKFDIEWLKAMKKSLLTAVVKLYPSLEMDQLKLYFHYQPTYYHLHIHLIHVQADVGGSQAISKAVSFDSVIEYLTLMAKPEDSMASVNLVYSVGEATELWQRIFEPLKKGETPVI